MNLQNVHNFQYMGTFYFGQDHQPLKLLLDTGSSWTWVAGEECTEAKGCPNSRLKRTESFSTHGRPEIVHYAQGSLLGNVATDQISLDGKESATVRFLEAKRASDLSNLFSDGILGLAPRAGRGGVLMIE